MGLGGLVLRSLILYLKSMRIMMFQFSGVYYKFLGLQGFRVRGLGMQSKCYVT